MACIPNFLVEMRSFRLLLHQWPLSSLSGDKNVLSQILVYIFYGYKVVSFVICYIKPISIESSSRQTNSEDTFNIQPKKTT